MAFTDPPNTAVFICRHVSQGAPVLFVSHDKDGDWQFLCGVEHGGPQVERPLLVCLSEALELDRSLHELGSLCTNHHAQRASAAEAWAIVDDGEEFIRRCVREFGWAVQLVPSGASSEEPAFAYTVGLHRSFGHPELIIFGLGLEDMHSVLNLLGDLIKDGRVLHAGERVADVLVGRDLLLREVTSDTCFRSHVGYAMWFYGGRPFKLLQALWPDRHGMFPGEGAAEPGICALQPLLA